MTRRIAYAALAALLALMGLACQGQGNDPGKDKPPICAQGPDGRPRVTPCRVSTPEIMPHPTK